MVSTVGETFWYFRNEKSLLVLYFTELFFIEHVSVITSSLCHLFYSKTVSCVAPKHTLNLWFNWFWCQEICRNQDLLFKRKWSSKFLNSFCLIVQLITRVWKLKFEIYFHFSEGFFLCCSQLHLSEILSHSLIFLIRNEVWKFPQVQNFSLNKVIF